jgi:HTH-type transcriptional regulator/antitoxin HigA
MWLDGDSPVIGMSLRLDRIDNFWFVLRHEIEHVLRGDAKDGPIIDELDEIDEDQRPEEVAANAAASDFCVPEADIKDFIARLHPIYSEERLRGFSRLMKRHTGIVAGQLRRRIKRYDLFSRHLVKVRQHLVQSALTDGYGQRISSSLD